MGKLIFWDVDTQHDFVRASGKLYVPGSEALLPTLRALTDHAHAGGIPIVASADNHLPTDSEISAAPDWSTTFPPHCMQGAPGQLKVAETTLVDPLVIAPEPQDPAALAARVRAHRGDFLLLKQAVDVFAANANTIALLGTLAPDTVVLYGVATDFCNRYAVEGLLRHRPDARLMLVTDAIRAIDPDRGDALVRSWIARGVVPVLAAQVLRGV